MATQSGQLSRRELERARKRRNEYHLAADRLDAAACRVQEATGDLLQAIGYARRARVGLAQRIVPVRNGLLTDVGILEELREEAEALRDEQL